MRESLLSLCKGYLDAVEAERVEVERQLDEEATKAAAEREASGEVEDHDTRKLKKV